METATFSDTEIAYFIHILIKYLADEDIRKVIRLLSSRVGEGSDQK